MKNIIKLTVRMMTTESNNLVPVMGWRAYENLVDKIFFAKRIHPHCTIAVSEVNHVYTITIPLALIPSKAKLQLLDTNAKVFELLFNFGYLMNKYFEVTSYIEND